MKQLKIKKKLLLLYFFLCCFFGDGVSAAPMISNISGTVSNGGAITVFGSGFGVKTTPAPFLWDNFENGINGNYIAGNGNWVEYDFSSHKYTNTTSYSGSMSAQNHTTADAWFAAIGQKGLNSDVAYVSFYAKWRTYSGTYSGHTVMKFFRINAQPDFYTSRPSQWFTIFPNNNDWFYSAGVDSGGSDLSQQDLCGGNAPACTQATMPTDNGPWGRFEFYYKLSTPGVANGLATSWWNYRKEYDLPNQMNRLSGSGGQHIDNFLIPAMNDEQGGNVLFDYYVDDVYVDRTPQRIEVCDSSTWAARKHCEPQIPSAWMDTSITVSVNIPHFANGSTAYVYVLDTANTSNVNGYPVIIGGGDTPVACNTVTTANFSQSTYSAYGAPYDLFASNAQLVDAKCTASDPHTITATIGKTGDTTRIVYTKGYYFDPSINNWAQYTSTCTGTLNGDWCAGPTTATITDPDLSTASAGTPAYFVGMVCSVQGGGWKCGCRDTNCTNFYWMIQGAGM